MVCPDSAVEWPAGKCGDGLLDNDCEECDDGNTNVGDGCDDACVVEEGWVCDPDCTEIGTCEISGEYCESNEDCSAVSGICPHQEPSWKSQYCNNPSDCHWGTCTGQYGGGACSNDTNCYDHVPGSCV